MARLLRIIFPVPFIMSPLVGMNEKQFLNFAPEILRTQLLLFVALIIAAAILFSFISINLMCSFPWSSYVLVWGEAV